MDNTEIKKLRSLTSFEALVDYLRDELDWPIEAEDAEDVAFDYSAAELGIDPLHAVKIQSIKQVRPLEDGQPWGIFYLEFESQRLPVVVLRRILKALVPASRNRDPNRPAWQMSDLLFISSQGEPDKRSISFAHFHETEDGKNELRTFSWDSRESHLYYIKNLNLEALRWPARGVDAAAWRGQWSQAFTVPHRYVPTTAQMLAEQMAHLAADIRDTVLDIYEVEQTGGPLHQLHLSFRLTLINDLSKEDFADMYAQTVTYGLFSARATRQGEFAIQDVAAMIPNTNPFLRELLEQLTHQDAVDLDELGVEQLASLLREVDMEAILRDFGRQRRGEDPVIHFYETFLGAYDAEKKAQRGVFYTPDPAVSFIVRSVDYILRTEFDCPDGLADTGTMQWKGQTVPKVQLLDPATGTGTFLQYVIQVIWDTFYQKNKNMSAAERKAKWNRYVSEHLLPRLHGFELMMAPYTIAHMKLGLKLKETGYEFGSDERLRVYLTNALQPAHEVPRTETPALAHEVEQSMRVKTDQPILAVIGNPPYSVSSSNSGEWITDLVKKNYYPNDSYREHNPKLLLDDYVKFFRFAQWRINRTQSGVIGFITNHGYLDGPIFR
jgi:type I restriction-modification system DNA methylase subunit